MRTTAYRGGGAFVGLILILSTSCLRSPEQKYARYMERARQYAAKGDQAAALIEFRNASAAKPESAEPHYEAGLLLKAKGERINAALAFQKATQVDSTHIKAHLQLAELLSLGTDRRTIEQGATLARHVLELAPDDPDAQSILALVDLRLGNLAAAAEELNDAVKKHPKHVGLALNLARTRAAQKDPAGAERALLDGIAAAPEAVELILALGDFYLRQGSSQRAEEQYRRALALDSKQSAALFAIGMIESQRHRNGEAEQTFKKLARGDDPRFRTALAAFFLEQGKKDDAITELERLVKADPKDERARKALVAGYISRGQTSRAEELVNQAVSSGFPDGDALLVRAKVSLLKKDVDRAEADLVKAKDLLPNSSEVRFFLARVAKIRGNVQRAIDELTAAVEMDPRFLAARVELARLFFEERGEARDALTLLNEAPPSQRSSVALVLQRNWSLMALGRSQEARTGVDGVLKVARLPEALLQRAALQADVRSYAEAQANLEEALRKSPEDIRILHLILSIYKAQGNAEAGLERIRQHVAERPKSGALQGFLGRALLANGKHAEARAALEAAVALSPRLRASQLDLAQLDGLEGKRDSARARLKTLVDSDTDGSVHVRLAELYQADARYDDAIEQYRTAIATNSNNVFALNNLAYLIADTNGNPSEGLRYAQKAKELAPENPVIDDTLGWSYYRSGVYSLAVRHLEMAVKGEGSARNLYHLSMAYFRNGEGTKGRATLDQALRADADLPEAAEAREVQNNVGKTNQLDEAR